jgi:hypothetical protein
MTGTVLSDTAMLVGASALLAIACAALVLVVLGKFGKASVNLGSMAAKIEAVAGEFQQNGGSSMKDALNRIEQRLAVIEENQAQSRAAALSVTERVSAIEDLLTQPKRRVS